jgi:hypothetical protein
MLMIETSRWERINRAWIVRGRKKRIYTSSSGPAKR